MSCLYHIWTSSSALVCNFGDMENIIVNVVSSGNSSSSERSVNQPSSPPRVAPDSVRAMVTPGSKDRPIRIASDSGSSSSDEEPAPTESAIEGAILGAFLNDRMRLLEKERALRKRIQAERDALKKELEETKKRGDGAGPSRRTP